MPKTKTVSPVNNQIAIVAIALIVGGFFGYWYGKSASPFGRDYLTQTAKMMRDYGNSATQYGIMMSEAGTMMQQRGQRWGDSVMVQKGKELFTAGGMMTTQGGTMMSQGSGMMGMMGRW